MAARKMTVAELLAALEAQVLAGHGDASVCVQNGDDVREFVLHVDGDQDCEWVDGSWVGRDGENMVYVTVGTPDPTCTCPICGRKGLASSYLGVCDQCQRELDIEDLERIDQDMLDNARG
jgi:hypothetical protein